MVTIWSIKSFKALFAKGGALASWVINVPVPMLDKLVQKMPPVMAEPSPYGAIYSFNWFSATGTAIVIAALISILYLRMKPADAVQTARETFRELALPIYSIGMKKLEIYAGSY